MEVKKSFERLTVIDLTNFLLCHMYITARLQLGPKIIPPRQGPILTQKIKFSPRVHLVFKKILPPTRNKKSQNTKNDVINYQIWEKACAKGHFCSFLLKMKFVDTIKSCNLSKAELPSVLERNQPYYA